jgi:hypothetical protein
VAFLVDVKDYGIVVYGEHLWWDTTYRWNIAPPGNQQEISTGNSFIDDSYVYGPEIDVMGTNTTKCIWTDYDDSGPDFGIYGDYNDG